MFGGPLPFQPSATAQITLSLLYYTFLMRKCGSAVDSERKEHNHSQEADASSFHRNTHATSGQRPLKKDVHCSLDCKPSGQFLNA